jgi:hypothetical protein
MRRARPDVRMVKLRQQMGFCQLPVTTATTMPAAAANHVGHATAQRAVVPPRPPPHALGRCSLRCPI